MHELIGSDNTLLNRSRKEIGEELDRRIASVADGFAKDHSDYSKQVGHIQGMRQALEIMEGIARKMAG